MKQWKNKKSYRIIGDLFYDMVGSLLMGIGVYCFVDPANIAPGGMSGIAILIKYLVNVPIGLMTFILNIPLLILSYRYLGKKFTVNTIKSLIINTVILDYVVAPLIPQYIGDRLIGSVFGGILMGVGLAIIFMRGSTTGGTDIMSYLMQLKFPHMPIGRAILIVDCVIIAASMAVFQNIETGLFGIISLFCCTKSIDSIIYGMEKGTKFTICSKCSKEISEKIMEDLERGVTLLKGIGAYTKEEQQVIICVVRKQEYARVKSIIYEIDPMAFVTVSEVDEVFGEGFKPIHKR